MMTLEEQRDRLTNEEKSIGSNVCNNLYEYLSQEISTLPLKFQSTDMLLFVIQLLTTNVIVQNTDKPKEVAKVFYDNLIKMFNNINEELVSYEN